MNDRPNIILVYTDQQRYDTIGVNGNSWIRTPNIDQMAEEGAHFTNSFVSCPLCMPARVAMFTGRYSHANMSINNHLPMAHREVSLLSTLKQVGYETALIGKNHCFDNQRLHDSFDYVKETTHLGFRNPGTDEEKRIGDVRTGTMQRPFAPDPVPAESNLSALLFRDAIRYAQVDRGQRPYFLWLSVPDPHPPYMVCEPYASMYRETNVPLPEFPANEMADKPYRQQLVRGWNRYGIDYPDNTIATLIRTYAGMVSYIDDQMGLLLQRLGDSGDLDNTIVIFTSDHGDYMGDHGLIRKGPQIYDCLTHVPLVIYGPQYFSPRRSGAMISQVDLLPTLLDLAGLQLPYGVHGRSFLPVLQGTNDEHREFVFMEHGEPGEPLHALDELDREYSVRLAESRGHHLAPEICRGKTRGIRTRNWKYVYNFRDTDELYDIAHDPAEHHNLIHMSKHRAITDHLRGKLVDTLVSSENDFPMLSAPTAREQAIRENTEASHRVTFGI